MEEQQQQQPEIRSTPYANPMNNYGSSILFLTNPNNELYRLELTFRNMVLDDNDKPRSAGAPLLNEQGVSSVIGMVSDTVNQVTILSNLKKNDIPALIDFLADTLACDLMVNRITYGITDASARNKIYYSALTRAYICMKRAFEGDDKRFWKGSTQEITTRHDDSNKREGLMSRVVGWGK